MKPIVFEVGQRAQGNDLHIAPERIGMECTILEDAKAITSHEAISGNTITTYAYRVLWADGVERYCPVSGLTLALPKRGDMDTKMSFDSLPAEVVRAMRYGSNPDY